MTANSVSKIPLSIGLCLLILTQCVFSQSSTFDRGVVIDNVAELENKEQGYALYLPSNYDAAKKWPILYIFDPFARGKIPAGLFRGAAEKYSYIIAASNNSKNGLGGQQQTGIISALWKDTHTRFNIDEKRSYAAGLSGGARVANYFAYSCNGCIAGVISAGAAFLPGMPLKESLPYAFFGTAGVDDFNYPEMVETERSLSEITSDISGAHRLAVFDAGHQWPAPELTFEALEWFDLQAMKKGALNKNDAFVQKMFSRDRARAESLLQKGKVLEPWRAFQALIADFKDFKEVADPGESSQKLAQLSGSKELKAALREEKEFFKKQTETLQRVVDISENLSDAGSKQDALRRLTLEIEPLRKMSDKTEDSGDRRYACRTLFAIFSRGYETAMFRYLPAKEYKNAAANLELAAMAYPKSKNAQIELAKVLALDDRKKEAVEALGRAVQNGFNDCRVLATEETFNALRASRDFLKLKAAAGCNN